MLGGWEDINNSGGRKGKSVYFRWEGFLGNITQDSGSLPPKKLRPLFLLNNGLFYLWIIALFPMLTMGFHCYGDEKGLNSEESTIDAAMWRSSSYL